MIIRLLLALGAMFPMALFAETVIVPGGTYSPLFRDKNEIDTKVPALVVDAKPITNEQFAAFVKKNPQWQRSKAPRLFVEKGYLSHWSGDKTFTKDLAQQPVVWVSWFAAKAYCESRGMRLPTIAEWEHLSDIQNPIYEGDILKWYSLPAKSLRPVGQGAANKYGVYDSWGLIWEWAEDFSSVIMAGDSRGTVSEGFFCGAAAIGAKDPSEYAAFLRYAFRSSLQASFGTSSLGFRCVQNQGVNP